MTRKQTIVIADDHLLIAKAIASIIEQFDRFEILYEAENGKVLMEKLKSNPAVPDIVLLDISMPIMDGYETAQWLHLNFPAIKIMALTMQGDDAALIGMVKAGARGYLNKNVHPADLEKALIELTDKGFYYPDWVSSRILHSLANESKNLQSRIKLSDREIEFLKYSCTEMTYKEIGEIMFCSSRTVESYRDSLFEKLGVKTRVALALYAVKVGLHTL
jgi:DNA-binding NarL/FixJ family response regulator